LFNKERELVSAFSCKSEDFLRAVSKKTVERSFVVHEFDSHFGVADIVIGTIKPHSRRASRVPINPNWITPLAALKRGATIETSKFALSYGISRQGTTKRLLEYEQAGFLNKVSKDTFEVIREYSPFADLIISIEAKLKDWKKALVQARRYNRFSDFAFVLLDGSKAASAIQNINTFKSFNIGLISLTEDQLRFHHIPSRNKKKMPEYYFRADEAAYDAFYEDNLLQMRFQTGK
jgi:hypothetical protein